MNNINDKLSKIRNHRVHLDDEAVKKALAIENERKQVIKQLKALAPRIKDLMTIGQELISNAIPLGNPNSFPDWGTSLESTTWSHHVGYIPRYPIFGIGQMGGGACGDHFAVDEKGNVTNLGIDRENKFVDEDDKFFISKAKSFIAGFDDFEKRVIEYVDNLK